MTGQYFEKAMSTTCGDGFRCELDRKSLKPSRGVPVAMAGIFTDRRAQRINPGRVWDANNSQLIPVTGSLSKIDGFTVTAGRIIFITA